MQAESYRVGEQSHCQPSAGMLGARAGRLGRGGNTTVGTLASGTHTVGIGLNFCCAPRTFSYYLARPAHYLFYCF